MANAREIRDRMRSIQDTMKITNAMYMISSSKLRRAKKALANTEPYFYTLQSTMSRILRHLPEMHSEYFRDPNAAIDENTIRRAYVVVTADKGMAGAYNHNILKLAEEHIQNDKTQNYMSLVKSADIISNRKNYRLPTSSTIPFRIRH